MEEERIEEPFRIRRKIFHLVLGSVFIFSMMTIGTLRWVFLAVLSGGLILSFFQERWELPVITWFLRRYDKSSDSLPGQGPLTFFFGAVLTWFIFPAWAAVPAVIVLTFGDPIAYLGGKLIGGPELPWNRNKTWAGSLSFVVVPSLLLSLLWGPIPGIPVTIAGALVESVPWPFRVMGDDNVLIPLFSAFFIWLVSTLVALV